MVSVYPIAKERPTDEHAKRKLDAVNNLPVLTFDCRKVYLRFRSRLRQRLGNSPLQYCTFPHLLASWNIIRLIWGAWLCKMQRCQLQPSRCRLLVCCCRICFSSKPNAAPISYYSFKISFAASPSFTIFRNASIFLSQVGFKHRSAKRGGKLLHRAGKVDSQRPNWFSIISITVKRGSDQCDMDEI